MNGSYWTLGGYAIAQLLRLVSNVILAKLLFPEAFGLMVLVSVFLQGITMFSDIGIGPSIIQNEKGDEPTFLNTAWTMQVIRGFIIWLIVCIGAYPYSQFYGESLLFALLPVAGITAIISGFNSTSLFTANRRINLSRVTILDLFAQITSILIMVSWVLIHPTVWGLVAGGIAGALVKLLLSHIWLGEIKNKFHWDKDAASRLFKFGKWILISTALTFFAAQMDRLLLGFLMGTAALGIYSIAAMFNTTAGAAIQMLGSKVLFPYFSQLARENDDIKLYQTLRKTRIIIILGGWLSSVLLISFGAFLIEMLYDERYSDAVWMIQILPLGTLVGILSLSYQNVLLAKGYSSYITAILAIQLILQASVITIGYHLNGIVGIIIGLSLVGWLLYPAFAIAVKKLNLWQPEIDIPVIILAVFFIIAYINFMDFI